MSAPPPSIVHWHEGQGAIDRVERCLLSALMMTKHGRLACSGLTPGDFSSPGRRAVYEVVMSLKYPEPILVAREMERRGVPPPAGMHGWYTPVASLLDDGMWDQESIDEYVKAILAASAQRRAERRRST